MKLICWSTRNLTIALLAVCALGLAALGRTIQTEQASAVADISVVAIDTDITGNTATHCDANGDPQLDYPCNNSTVLGAINSCRSINAWPLDDR